MSDFFDDHHRIAVALESIAADFHKLVEHALGSITGIRVEPGTPTPRGQAMAKPKVSVLKMAAGAAKAAPPKKMAAGAVPVDFVFGDNQDSTCTVFATNSAGDKLSIDGVATLTVSSSDPLTVSVDPPVGATFVMHGLKLSVPGTPVEITVTATWNPPATVGPFSFSLPVDTTAGPAGGIVVVPGTPTTRP